tara:strand:- start:2291 stop:2617 length:327 start_codon:yes stop_codon:yes gene_type:complete
MKYYIFGWIASGLSTIYRLPQIYKVFKNKNVKGISCTSYLVQSTSYCFYIVHGILNQDNPIIAMGSVAIFQNMIIIFLYMYYKNNIIPVEDKKPSDAKENIEIISVNQ